MIYTELEDGTIQRDNLDGSFTFIPPDLANTDYKAYLKSIAEVPSE